MFSKSDKLYLRNFAALGRWKTAKHAIAAYTAVPASFSVWEFLQSPNLKLLFAYLIVIIVIVIMQVLISGKVAHYQASVDLLKTRLDHPPNKSKDLQSGQNSTKLTETNDGNDR